MNRRSLFSLLVLLVLCACAPGSAPPTPLATITPTLYLGSPWPPISTPHPGAMTAGGSFITFTPTALPTPGGPANAYAVISVPEGDVLNIRSGPGVENPILGTLSPTESGLEPTGQSTVVGEGPWVEIRIPGGGNGWVSAEFLTEQVPPAVFCADARVPALLQDLEAAATAPEGASLEPLVSPAHGLEVAYLRSGTVAYYSPEEAGWAFQSTYAVDWGLAAGSGEPVTGTFSEVVLPALQAVFRNGDLYCNEIKLGGATYPVAWPTEYANLNFYSIHSPGDDPSYAGLDWRTWLVGVEYVDGQPYLFALLHFRWEP